MSQPELDDKTPMKNKANAKKPVNNSGAQPAPPPGLETATGQPGPAEANLLEAILEAIATLELDGTICYVNSEFERGSGWKREELIGKKIFDIGFLPKKEVQRIGNELIPKLMAQGSVRNFETISVRKDGTSFPVLMSWTLTRDNNGKPKNIITVARDITERKKAEEAFIENEKKCQALFDNVSDGIMLADIKSQKFFNANKVMGRMLGYSREEINKLGVMDIHPRKDLPYVIEQFEKMARNEITLAENIPVKRKDGSVFYADIGSAPITLAGKSYLLGSFRDITERKKTKEELRRSEKKYHSLFENMINGFAYHQIVLDGNGKPVDYIFLNVNKTFEEFTGLQRKDIIGKRVTEAIPGIKEAKPDLISIYGKVALTGKPTSLEFFFEPLGKWYSVTVYSPQKGYFVAIFNDTTERKKVEEQAKQLQGNLQLQIDRMPIGLIVWDKKFRVQTWNPAAENIFGYTAEEALGKHPYNIIVSEEARSQVEDILSRLLEGDMAASTVNENITKDGRTIICDWANTPLKDGDGKVTGILSMVQDITERKKAEAALADSEGYLAHLLDSIGSGIMVIDPADHRIVEVNSYAAKMIGTSKDKIIGRKCHKFICPKDEGQCPVTDLGQTIDHSERLLVKANGEQLPVLKSVSEILRNGKSYLVESLVDITERKQVEEKLRHAAEEWRTTFDSISDLVSVQDRNYRFLRVNKAFARALGKKPKELIGKTCYEVVHGTSEPPAYCPNISVLKTNKAATAEYYDLKSGLYLQESSWPILDDKGKVAISIHVARDITERKKAEVVLQKSERNFRNSIDNSPLGVSIISRSGRLVYANRAFLNIYGYESVAELKSVPLNKRYTPESHRRHLERKEMSKRSLPIPRSYEISIIRKNSEIRNLQVTWENVFWDGQPRVQMLYQDITERRKMQEQLIITDRLASVGELAAGVAHELNNPLTGVIGFSQLLLEKDIPEDIREDVDIIYREARRSAEVVKNLLTFARKHVPQKRLLSLNSVIEKVLQLRAYEQRVNNIAVVNRLDPNLPQAMSDEFQLQQVFLNIILNAEFSMIEARNGGTLTITTEKVNSVVRASISDDGPGISKLALGHLFDPFFTTKEVGKGTGLGLSICHGIVNEHGGRIYAESPPGEGATFIVELPLNRKAKKEKGS